MSVRTVACGCRHSDKDYRLAHIVAKRAAERLAGAEAVIDTLGITTTRRRPATDFFTTATRNLLHAEDEAGVERHVLLSIVGIDGSPFGYYRAKVAQEDVARTLDADVMILRATQFQTSPSRCWSGAGQDRSSSFRR